MVFQYNPYAQSNQQMVGAQNPYGSQNAFMNQGQPVKKTFAVPTFVFWLIIVLFLGFAVALWFIL